MNEFLKTNVFFALTRDALYFRLFEHSRYPWDVLPSIGSFVRDLQSTLSKDLYDEIKPGVWVAKNCRLHDYVTLIGPTIIGPETEIRPGAFVRGNVLIGSRTVVGNSTELKNCVLMDGVQAPHYNYVGDSICGCDAHLGAGVILSNLRADKQNICVRIGAERIETGLRKFGAVLGARAEIGCNAVLNPGSVVGEDSRVSPLTSLRGVVPPRSLCKQDGGIVPLRLS